MKIIYSCNICNFLENCILLLNILGGNRLFVEKYMSQKKNYTYCHFDLSLHLEDSLKKSICLVSSSITFFLSLQ